MPHDGSMGGICVLDTKFMHIARLSVFTRFEVQRSYAEFKTAQRDALAARKALLGTVPAAQVQAFQKRMEAALAQSTAAQEELEKHRSAIVLCEQMEDTYKTENSIVLAQLREIRQERDRLKDLVHSIQTNATHDRACEMKTVLSHKDSELNRMSQALSRAQADASWVARGLQQAQVSKRQHPGIRLHWLSETTCLHLAERVLHVASSGGFFVGVFAMEDQTA